MKRSKATKLKDQCDAMTLALMIPEVKKIIKETAQKISDKHNGKK